MKRLLLAVLLLAVAAPVVTAVAGCRAEGEVQNPVD